MKDRKLAALFFTACALLAISPLTAGEAENILENSGVKGGLVVVIGCDDPALIAGLRANDSYLVQALGLDVKETGEAR